MNGLPSPAFLFGAGLDEWALLAAICFLLFGPRRLPEIARTIGRTLEKFRRAAADFREQIERLDLSEPAAPSPPKPASPPPEAAPRDRAGPTGGTS